MQGVPRLRDAIAFGAGLRRPEGVAVTADGRVLASDRGGGFAEVELDGVRRRVGGLGGEPNGLAVDRQGRTVVANWSAGIQRLDLVTGEQDLHVATVDGCSAAWANFPVVDRDDAIWCSVSTQNASVAHVLATGLDDGFIVRVDQDGSAVVAADGIPFPNGMALSAAGDALFVCRSALGDVARYPIRSDRSLGPPERYGPPLGVRRRSDFGVHLVDAVRDGSALAAWGVTDGCAFDRAGNLWVTLPRANRLIVITPEADVHVVWDDPKGELVRQPTNVAFGGPDLDLVYIAQLTSEVLVRARTSVPGAPLVHQA